MALATHAKEQKAPASARSSAVSHPSVDVSTLAAYPTTRQAARMLRVAPSTLTRRTDLEVFPRGQDHCLRPGDVVRLTRYFKKRSELDVAGELIDLVVEKAPDAYDEIEQELQEALQKREVSKGDPKRFLSIARASLPPEIYGRVEAILRDEGLSSR